MIEKGQRINDRYEIIKSIGEGGMANVYLAYDTILDRRVAVKVLRGDLSNDEKFVRRFQREALSASSLTHPNIVEMYDVGEDNGIYYIVMEYIEGKTLKQLIKKRGALTISEAIDIMLQITDGISVAHNSYIIHRDLKPQNIMIKEDGTIKITDFGIAMALNSTQLTQTNSVMGSVHYLPPEQANGKGATIRSDIYSMGILFFELLAGSVPFKGDNAVEIALKQMKDAIPSVRKFNPSIPQSVENVIIKATAKNPKNRYSDSKEMHDDLLTVLDDDRINDPKYVFEYPEHEVEENTKVLKEIKEKTNKELDKENDITKEIDDLVYDKDEKIVKRTNLIIIILASIFGLILLLFLLFFLIIPNFTKIPDVTVPDVSNMEVAKAEKKLKEVGFEVALETIKEESDKIEKGKVIRTEPSKDRSIKKGTKVTIYESSGDKSYTVIDFVGENYIEIKTELEKVYGIKVKIDEKEVDTSKEYGDEEIVGQSVEAGKVLAEGDEITLYIASKVPTYPDMVNLGWTESDVVSFCSEYELSCEIKHEETTEFTEGTLIRQSRPAKTPIEKTTYKYDFSVSFAVKPGKVEGISEPSGEVDPKEANKIEDEKTE